VPANRDRRPLFLLGFHRGGATFVQRLLNCHRQVTIWGENGGLVSRLRLLHRDFAQFANPVDVAEFARFQEFTTWYEPFVSPAGGDGLLAAMAAFLESLYAVDGSLIWGFKEIRHGNPRDIGFLRQLFPGAGLVLLIRQPRELLNSQVHVAWSPAQGVATKVYVDAFIKDYLRTVMAFSRAAKRWPDQAWIYSYEALRDREDVLAGLLSRIGIGEKDMDSDLMDQVRGTRVGSSFGESGRGREVAPGEAAAALSALDEMLTACLAEPRYMPVRETLERLYPGLELYPG
jgi:Sulfotransferase family